MPLQTLFSRPSCTLAEAVGGQRDLNPKRSPDPQPPRRGASPSVGSLLPPPAGGRRVSGDACASQTLEPQRAGASSRSRVRDPYLHPSGQSQQRTRVHEDYLSCGER